MTITKRAAKRNEDIARAREAAEADLLTFIKLVAPHRVLGAIHEELCTWWTREAGNDNQLCLLPRDHQKSAMIAYRVAWEITRHPDTTILYISATSTLAEKQLYFIKNILTSKRYRTFWPEMTAPDEGKREKWTNVEIMVDHPKRKQEGVRDATIRTAGLTTNIVGLHFKIVVLDDVVVYDNAYTEEGRKKVESQYSLLASIETTGSEEWVVGTRYHPKDLYSKLVEMKEPYFNEYGEIEGERPVYEVFERVLEDSPERDGTGEYLWPKQRRSDGKVYGFDAAERARKFAKYLDKAQFWAQYYNDPNDPGNTNISPDRFQYYDQAHLKQKDGYWYLKDKKLNIYAAIDFAYTIETTSDFTAIVVIGMDCDNNIYVLEIDRFKTKKILEMFERTLRLFTKWEFKKIRAEINAAQVAIVEQFKDYRKQYGIYFSIDEQTATRHTGTKEERMKAILNPRYDSLAVWHYKGGNCQPLEEELIAHKPAHDDIMDALANACSIAIAPMQRSQRRSQHNVVYNNKWGGVAH